MKIENGTVFLEDCKRLSPHTKKDVIYTDITETRVCVPMKLLIRLYEGTKHIYEAKGGNWEQYCDSFFEDTKE